MAKLTSRSCFRPLGFQHFVAAAVEFVLPALQLGESVEDNKQDTVMCVAFSDLRICQLGGLFGIDANRKQAEWTAMDQSPKDSFILLSPFLFAPILFRLALRRRRRRVG